MSPRCTLTKVSVGCMVDWLGGFIDATPEQLAACARSAHTHDRG
jgi:hypothetical protein